MRGGGLRLAAALLVLPVHAIPAHAAPVAPQELSGLADFVDGVVAAQIAAREVAGAVVTVVHRDQVLFTRGYGWADIDKGMSVSGNDTLVRPGSVSKLFTWVLLMQEVERGRVSLDADVNSYLDFHIPEFDGQPIRVRDLLSHSAGFEDVSGIIVRKRSELVPLAGFLKANMPRRLWPAGREIAYSNYGAALAGYIVERVSGEAFAAHAERHLFAPLSMTSTTFQEPLPDVLARRMAQGYRLEQGQFVPQPPEWISAIAPAGSATTSAPDMTRFMRALLNGGELGAARILQPESVTLLTSDSLRNAPGLPGLAHGFFVFREQRPRLVGHGGNTIDFHSIMVISPEARLGFFISMTGGDGSYKARTELADAVIGRLFPEAPAPSAEKAEQVPSGVYRTNRRDHRAPVEAAHDMRVAASGGGSLTVTTQGQQTRWRRVGPSLYERVTGARSGGPYERLQFTFAQGRPRLSFSVQPHVLYHQLQPTPMEECVWPCLASETYAGHQR